MGAGGSLEAPYKLKASVPSGTYHLVLDHITIKSCEVTFDLIWRRGTTDTALATWAVQFEPRLVGFDAQPYEVDQAAAAIDWQDGDLFVFRYTAAAACDLQSWIPNGDGHLANGRIPNITLPK